MANTPREVKKALRAAVRARRQAMNTPTGEALRDSVLTLPELSGAAVVTAYVARTGEPDPGPLVAELRSRGVQVLMPVLRPDFDLDWAVEDGTHATSSVHASLSEPTGPRLGPDAVAEADVVLVPGLAVDWQGHRLGNGAGCYDRALARVDASTLVAVLLHDGEISDVPIPAEPHDRAVGAAVTPSGVARFGVHAGG